MRKVIIYGAGALGRVVYRLVKDKCSVICFLDRNPQLNHTKQCGISVMVPEVFEDDRNAVVLVSMVAAAFCSVKRYLQKLGFRNVVFANDFIGELYPNIPVWKNWLLKDKFCAGGGILEDLADDRSKADYQNSMRWLADRNDEGLTVHDKNTYFPDFLTASIQKYCSLMCDTNILESGYGEQFLKLVKQGHIYGFIVWPVLDMPKAADRKTIFYVQAGKHQEGYKTRIGTAELVDSLEPVWCVERSLDEQMAGITVDYLRVSSADPVLPVLAGGMEMIRKNRPMIAVNIGHYEEDFTCAPEFLKNNLQRYLFFYRCHKYQACDFIIYAVPEEKYVKERSLANLNLCE